MYIETHLQFTRVENALIVFFEKTHFYPCFDLASETINPLKLGNYCDC